MGIVLVGMPGIAEKGVVHSDSSDSSSLTLLRSHEPNFYCPRSVNGNDSGQLRPARSRSEKNNDGLGRDGSSLLFSLTFDRGGSWREIERSRTKAQKQMGNNCDYLGK